MRKLTDNARRARAILAQDSAALPLACERIAAREVEKVLSEFFILKGKVSFKTQRKGKIVITIEAEAEGVKPFGIIG